MSNKNKIVYSNIQPNPKESKVWLHPHDGLKTYNQKKQEWSQSTNNGSTNDAISTFTISEIEYKYEQGMNWLEWINSKYNSDLVIYDGYDSTPSLTDIVIVNVIGKSTPYVLHDPEKGWGDDGWAINEKWGNIIKSTDYNLMFPG